jgi:hypothetical protein
MSEAAGAVSAGASGGNAEVSGQAGAAGAVVEGASGAGVKGAQESKPVAAHWTDSFDPGLKDYVTNKGFQDPKMLLESYVNLEKLRGVPQERLLKLPDSADAPEWNDVYSKLGKPPTPEGYGFIVNEGADKTFADWAKNTFHQLNLSTTQAQSLIEQLKEFDSVQTVHEQEKYAIEVQEQTKALQKEWGAAYQQNIARAQAAYRSFGLPDSALKALEGAMGFDGVMKFMHNIGSRIGEHGFVSGQSGQGFGDGVILTPSQAKSRIQALKSDPEFTSRYIKGDVKARSEMSRLHEMAAASD